jgi:Fe-S oxidoreductase
VLLRDERCCGHDLLWSGDFEGFSRLAKHNLEAIEKSGAKRVIFSCPEGYRTFKLDYPEHFGKLGFEVEHISEVVAARISKVALELNPRKGVITYQDPCRLGRHLGVYEPPRAMLNAIPELELREMERSRSSSICCGVSAWLNCDSCTKLLQVQRLKEAQSTGAKVLITACPKCEIHFRCAMSGEDGAPKIETKDLSTLIVELIRKGKQAGKKAGKTETKARGTAKKARKTKKTAKTRKTQKTRRTGRK